MLIRTFGFFDVSRLAASYTLINSKERVESDDPLHTRVWRTPLDAAREKPWRAAEAFLTKLRGEASALFNGIPPVITNAVVRSISPGGRIDWHQDKGEGVQVHVCLVPSPGAWLYCGGEGVVLGWGHVTAIERAAWHSEINFGPVTMSKLVLDMALPDVDA